MNQKQYEQFKQIEIPAQYKHSYDTRTQNEILLSSKLVQCISEINLTRIRKYADLRASNQQHYNNKGKDLQFSLPTNLDFIKNDTFFFLCLSGFPNFPGQYKQLSLPGQIYRYTISVLRKQNASLSQQQYFQKHKNFSFQNQTEHIHKIINKALQKRTKDGKMRKIVILFHSFGSFLLINYLNKYGGSKISGLVDLAGIPITMYNRFNLMSKLLYKYKKQYEIQSKNQQQIDISFFEYLIENSNRIYTFILKLQQKYDIPKFLHRYHLVMFLSIFNQQVFKNAFYLARNYPKILKLFVVGRQDFIFKDLLQSQKLVHYCYVNKLEDNNKTYYKALTNSYNKLYKPLTILAPHPSSSPSPLPNIQQKFILYLNQAKHSMHIQKKIIPDLKSAIYQYLSVIYLTDQQLQLGLQVQNGVHLNKIDQIKSRL